MHCFNPGTLYEIFYVSRNIINKRWPLMDKSALEFTYEHLEFHKFSRVIPRRFPPSTHPFPPYPFPPHQPPSPLTSPPPAITLPSLPNPLPLQGVRSITPGKFLKFSMLVGEF